MIKKRSKKNGMTFVELMIVVIVMGIFTITVLIGKEVLNAAKIKSIIFKLNEYEKSVFIFKQTYDYLPGDFPRPDIWSEKKIANRCKTITASKQIKDATRDNIKGDGDGIVLPYDTQNNNPYESEWVACHLYLAGLLPDTKNTSTMIFVERAYITNSANKNLFSSSGYLIDKNNGFNILGNRTELEHGASGLIRGNAIYFNRLSTLHDAGWFSALDTITNKTLQAIDNKIDDGKPGDGQIVFGIFGNNDKNSFWNDSGKICNIPEKSKNNICAKDSVYEMPNVNMKSGSVLIYRPRWLNSEW